MQTNKQRDFANQGDTISRHGVYAWLCNMGHEHLADAIMDENRFPSAQPDHSGDVNGKVDLIDRQTAIDAVLDSIPGDEYWDEQVKKTISALPSAQPEPLTDKEQRIFLAAMGREEKVCEEVDRNHVREPYEDSLMRVCKEIRRKVKGALWT